MCIRDRDDIYKILYTDYISKDELKQGKVNWLGKMVQISDLSQEFKIKQNRLNSELLAYIRKLILSEYKDEDSQRIRITYPSNSNFELKVLDFAHQIIEILLNKMLETSTIEQDQELLNDLNLSYKKRFAIILRRNHKLILENQLRLISIAVEILKLSEKEQNFKKCYMTKFDKLDANQEQFRANRMRLKDYLKQIYLSIVIMK
eukprot:TRINITY_DN2769_c0_g1_i3.p1 TRINITY_DN2769_c0_g1~~TRINITY_DN2769_c0_g1_i3.p1  ORF type:complete len:204 (+),score=34.21 TRINITY_DN2769_c0_g1_i3:127-738(+)